MLQEASTTTDSVALKHDSASPDKFEDSLSDDPSKTPEQPAPSQSESESDKSNAQETIPHTNEQTASTDQKSTVDSAVPDSKEAERTVVAQETAEDQAVPLLTSDVPTEEMDKMTLKSPAPPPLNVDKLEDHSPNTQQQQQQQQHEGTSISPLAFIYY